MSNIFTIMRRAPKNTVGIFATIAAAIIIPAALFAWGPDRPTYTIENPADHVTFNSITNNPIVGDERNFVVVKDAANTADGGWQDNITVEPGKEYLVRVYVHNNAGANLNLKAINTRVSASVPTTTGKSVPLSGFVSADNSSPLKIWDDISFNSDRNFNIVYVAGSARIYNNGYAAGGNGQSLPDSIVTSAGAQIGYDAPNGEVPGCFQYVSYVYFKIKPQFAAVNNYEVTKQVRKAGETTWNETVATKPGDIVEYQLKYKNIGEVRQDNVVFRDTLPAGMTYVADSSYLQNGSNPTGVKISDNVTTATGVNVGNYNAQAAAYIKFSAKVSSNDSLPVCGANTLVNKVRVIVDGTQKEDTANVTVNKECAPTPPVVKYTCDALSVARISRTEFKFTTNYTVENATFKNITYVIRDANGNEVDRKTSVNNTLDYTRTVVGKYTVQALVTVTVNNIDKTITNDNCKKGFEVVELPIEYCTIPGKEHLPKDSPECKETPPVVKYTCDALSIARISRTEFKFTTSYTVENATFKKITYVIRDASGKEIDRKVTTANALDYTRTVVGKYTVQALVTVTVNGIDKTVTNNNCKKGFEVVELPIEYCTIPGKEHLPKDSPECKETPPVTPPVTPVTPVTPVAPVVSELPQTGIGEQLASFVGLGSMIAGGSYYVSSRRNVMDAWFKR